MRGVLIAAVSIALAAVLASWTALASMALIWVFGFWPVYPWPDKLWMWIRYALEAPANVIVHRWLIITGIVAALPFVAIGALVITWLVRKRPACGLRQDRLGDAGADEGAAISTDRKASDAAHPILVGKSGNTYHNFHGRTMRRLRSDRHRQRRSFVIPNCFAWQGSLVVLDIKGEVFRARRGTARPRGRMCICSIRHPRPAGLIAGTRSPRCSATRWRGSARSPAKPTCSFPRSTASAAAQTTKFWDAAGRQAFSAVATILAETPSEPLTMENVAQLFARDDGHEWLSGGTRRNPP